MGLRLSLLDRVISKANKVMQPLIAQSYFVVGTDTHVGKTYVSAGLIKHFVAKNIKTIGMKPVASGCELSVDNILINEDVSVLIENSNIAAPLDFINPYRFEPAIAPHIAAEKADVMIDLEIISSTYQALSKLADVVIVEGAGGFLVPLNTKETLADLAVKLDLPIILVVGVRLGCINHALLTVEAIERRGLKLAGWVANKIEPAMPMFEENLTTLRRHISAPCLSIVNWHGEVKFATLID